MMPRCHHRKSFDIYMHLIYVAASLAFGRVVLFFLYTSFFAPPGKKRCTENGRYRAAAGYEPLSSADCVSRINYTSYAVGILPSAERYSSSFVYRFLRSRAQKTIHRNIGSSRAITAGLNCFRKITA